MTQLNISWISLELYQMIYKEVYADLGFAFVINLIFTGRDQVLEETIRSSNVKIEFYTMFLTSNII